MTSTDLGKNYGNIILILLGILLASIGLKGFLLPNGFFDGGAVGISLLLQRFFQIDLSIFILVVNLPFILIGLRQISKEFAIKSAFAILALAIAVHWISIPIITHDKLLIAIFGGVFLGAGIGLSIRGGAVIDGAEVLAVYISRKSSLSVGDFIAVFNMILFLFVALTVNIETAMYSMLTYFSASKSVDFILNGIEEYIGVTIISPDSEKIREMLINDLRRGVTIYKTEGGFIRNEESQNERNALFCVVTRLEVTKLLSEVQRIDPDAFIIQQPVKDTRGGVIKKRPLY
ncbi:MAG: membrane protein [Oligoflexia bacterium]|nr:MAG: membrane protein [Oligoflexia bacterium]